MIPGSTIETRKKRRKRKKTKFERQTARLDTYFSQFVRLSDMNSEGFCKCVSCGKLKPWSGGKTHAGHFIGKHRSMNFRVRWDLKNVHCQCYNCNANLEGNKYEYAVFLLRKYGRAIINELKIKASKSFNPDIFKIEDKINYYRETVKALKIEKGVK